MIGDTGAGLREWTRLEVMSEEGTFRDYMK